MKKTKGTADGDEAAAAAEAEPAVEGKGRKKDFTDKVWAAMSDEAKNAHIKAKREARAKERASSKAAAAARAAEAEQVPAAEGKAVKKAKVKKTKRAADGDEATVAVKNTFSCITS